MALTKVHNRMISGSFANVLDYGATGDGTTDDTISIQAAFDAVEEVYFPKGTYQITDTINVGTLTKARNQSRFFGTSQGTKIVGSAAMAGKAMFKIEGSQTFQQFGNSFENLRLDLNGAAIGIDFYRGSITSSAKDIRIEDSASTSGSIGIRVYNSFNILLDEIQTVGINGPAIKYVARNGEAGFHNLTNNRITNSILQNQAASEVVNLVEFDLDTAADTMTIDNTALKADAVGSKNIYVNGVINQLSLNTLHIESSDTGIATASGFSSYISLNDCLFSAVTNCLDFQGTGNLVVTNCRFVNGSSSFIFKTMEANCYLMGPFAYDSGSYNITVQAGDGEIRRTEKRIIAVGTTKTASTVDDKTVFYNTGGTLNLTLPATDVVGDGFVVGVIQRGGAVTVTPDAADRILGISGTSAGATVTTSSTGCYLELTSQNTVGGSQNFWVVTSLNGTAATP